MPLSRLRLMQGILLASAFTVVTIGFYLMVSGKRVENFSWSALQLPDPMLTPSPANLKSLVIGQEYEYPVTFTNTSNQEYVFRGASWICKGSACFSLKEPIDNIIPAGQSVIYAAHVSANKAGSFDVIIDVYIEAGGVLKTLPLRATGMVESSTTKQKP